MTRTEIYNKTRKVIKLFEPDSDSYKALSALLELAMSDHHRVSSQIVMIEKLHREMEEKKYTWADFATFEAESHHGEMTIVKWLNPDMQCSYLYAIGRYNCRKNCWKFDKELPENIEKQWINLPQR